MTTELLNRVKIDDEGGSTPVPLIQRPELYCELRDLIMEHVRTRFRTETDLETLHFAFGVKTPPEIEHLSYTMGRYDIDWPRSFTVTIVRRDNAVTVTYNDYSEHIFDAVAYHAKLL